MFKAKPLCIGILIVFFFALTANAVGTDKILEKIVMEFEPLIIKADNNKEHFVVVRSFMDKRSNNPNEFAETISNRIFNIFLDRYLGKRKLDLFNWKSLKSLKANPSSNTDIMNYNEGMWQKKLLETYVNGFLVTGTTDINGDNALINAELIDMATGKLLSASEVRVNLKAIDYEVPVQPPPSTPSESKNQEIVLNGRLFFNTIPQNAEIKFTNISEKFYQGIELKPGRYQVDVYADGFIKKTRWVSLQAGKDKKITVRLEPVNEFKDLQYKVVEGKDYKYEGYMKNEMKHGPGTYFFKSGAKYDGEWQNNKIHGKGTYLFSDGDKYVGSWKNGKMNGPGTYFYKSGDKFVGQWKNEMKTGAGTYHFKNGDKWEGLFVNNKKHGKGVYTWANGASKTEFWENGILTREHR